MDITLAVGSILGMCLLFMVIAFVVSEWIGEDVSVFLFLIAAICFFSYLAIVPA